MAVGTKRTARRPAAAPAPAPTPAAFVVENAACPRCDGPVYFHPDDWLHCRRCSRVKVRFTVATPPTGGKP